ncbi:MAG: hypothetical protein WC916_04175 [Candidatus Woesearchaeota archaeon]
MSIEKLLIGESYETYFTAAELGLNPILSDESTSLRIIDLFHNPYDHPVLSNYSAVICSLLLADPDIVPKGVIAGKNPFHSSNNQLFEGGRDIMDAALKLHIPFVLLARYDFGGSDNIYQEHEGKVAEISGKYLQSSDYEYGGYNAEKNFILITNHTFNQSNPQDYFRGNPSTWKKTYDLLEACLKQREEITKNPIINGKLSFDTIKGYAARYPEIEKMLM